MQKLQIYDYNNNITIDESPKLSVIKQSDLPDQVQETLSQLLDNNQIINKNGKQFPMIRIFLKSTEINEKQGTKQYINNCNKIKMIENIIKMQLSQQMTNSLIFQIKEIDSQNILVTNLLKYQNQYKNQKFLFINASGLYLDINFDLETVKNKFQLFEFRETNNSQNNINKQQKQIKIKKLILPNKSNLIHWENIKHQLKQEYISNFNMFQPNIIVLQLFANFDDDSCFQFDLNCIEKMVKYFRSRTKEKLIISLIINQDDYKEEYQQEINLNQKNFENIKVNIKLKQFINAIQQGILNENKGKKVFRSETQEILNIQTNQILPNNFNEYTRIRNGQLLQQQSFEQNTATVSEVQTSFNKIQIFDYNGNHKFINLLFEQNYLPLNQKTQLIVDYENNIVILFQQDLLKLYYAININEDKNIFVPQIIDLSVYMDEQNLKKTKRYIPPNIGIKNQQIYIFYGFLGNQLIEINTESNTIIKRFKTELSDDNKFISKTIKSQENLIERDGAMVSSLKINNQSTFLVIGGELGEKSRVSNQIECIFVEQNNFESGFLLKEILNRPQSLRPLRNQIILEEKDFIIVLPGDYDNQNYKYSQVINTSFYSKGQKLSFFQQKLQWQDVNFNYTNEKLRRKYPIHKFSGIQKNIIRISQNCWIASFMNIERIKDNNQQFCEPQFFQIKFDLQDLLLTIDIIILDQETLDAEIKK